MAKTTTASRLIRCLWRRLTRREEGVAAVEFALVTPVLILMAVCTVDLGMGFHRKMQVQNGADAGAAAASIIGFDAQAITLAITSAAPLAVADPAPRKFCGCPELWGISEVECAMVCPEGVPVGTYVSTSAQATYNSIFPYPIIGSAVTFRTTAVVRLQ